jgi:hypothetical protein
LLTLNGLTEDSSIYPDDQLLIFEGTGVTPTPTATVEAVEPTLTPTTTQRASVTPSAQTPTPTEEPAPRSNFLTNIFSGDTLWVGIGLVAVSVFGIVLLLFTSSRLK